MKIFITGASGYLGGRLALKLAEQGNEVHALVRNLENAKHLVQPNIRLFKGDLTDRYQIAWAMKGCEQVYHVAAMVKLWSRQRSDFYRTNVEGTRLVLESALELGVSKVVFTSTCSVIGPSLRHPMTEGDPRIVAFGSDYEFSKYLAEKLAVEFTAKGLAVTIVSVSKVFGPGLTRAPTTVNGLINRFISGKITFCPGPTSYIANYVYIDDAVEGHLLAMQHGAPGEKYIIGGENLSYSEFFASLANLTIRPGKLVPVGRSFGVVYGWCHFFLSILRGREPHFTGNGVKHIYCNKAFSTNKASRDLGYTYTPFSEAAAITIASLKKQRT